MSDTKTKTLPTASEGSETFNFDGVFREVNNSETRSQLYAAQKSVQNGCWKEAEDILNAEICKLSKGHDRRNLELVLSEIRRYQKHNIENSVKADSSVNWNQVYSRKPELFFELYTELPQSLFTIKTWKMSDVDAPDRVLVGRRLLSHLWITNNIRELHCSRISASMLLGVLIDHRVQEDGIAIYYRPFTDQEKKFVMHDIITNRLKDVEIVFPYPPLQGVAKTEIHCPDEGWEIDEALALSMGEGEVILRDYSIKILRTLNKDELYLFDPACSTGQFLSTMKSAFPKSFAFGQDLSPCMAKYAKNRLDESRCANAADPQIPDETADVSFVRFANSEVIKTVVARSMLEPLMKPVKTGGLLIIFGHTPVLVGSYDLLMRNDILIEQCVGGDLVYDGIFQYYVVKKV